MIYLAISLWPHLIAAAVIGLATGYVLGRMRVASRSGRAGNRTDPSAGASGGNP